jgi:hypothetical protein
MSILAWMKSLFSRRERYLSSYRSGMSKAKNGDFVGAIADYTETLNAPGAPADVLGMAMYNRALAYSAIHDDAKAAEDLKKVLSIPGLPENIKIAVSQRQERLRRREL